MNETTSSSGGSAKIIYILYLVGFVTGGLTNLIGVIMAYVNKKDADEIAASHYRFQIRTFWIMMLYSFIAFVLTFIVIGILVWIFIVVWLIIRCIKGMQMLDKNEIHPNPTTWMFS